MKRYGKNEVTKGSQLDAQAEEEILKRSRVLLEYSRRDDRSWRERSRKGVRYFFGDQWDPADKASLESRGQNATVENFVQPNVRLILGMMTAQPFDLVARPVGKFDNELGRRVTAGLKHIMDQNRAKMQIGKVAFTGLTYGMGVVHTGFFVRDRDPRTEPVQFVWTDPNQIRVDPDTRMPDWSDARYVLYSKNVLLHEAIEEMPECREKLMRAVGVLDPNLSDNKEMPSIDGATQYRGYTLYTPPVYAWPYSMQTKTTEDEPDLPAW